jgi:hypothetical protein
MEVQHDDGGKFVLTCSLLEASLIGSAIHITTPQINTGAKLARSEAWEGLEQFADDVIKAAMVPGSKDSVLAYGEEQARKLEKASTR